MAQKITVDKDFILYHAMQLPEWQRKQIALVLIGSTLTPESAYEAFATVSMLPTDELHHKVFGAQSCDDQEYCPDAARSSTPNGHGR